MSGESKERFFSFLGRWETYARELPAEEFQRLMLAACAYAFRGEDPPADLPLAARMAFVDVRARIDWEEEIRQAKQAAGSLGGKASQEKQRQAKASTHEADASKDKQTQADAKQEEADTSRRQADASTLKEKERERDIKEAELSLCEEKRRKPRGFKSWTPEEFRREAEKVAATRPEWAEILEDFVGYWCEPRGDGSPRFRGQEAFEIGRRFSTFRRRDSYGRTSVVLHPAAGKHTEEIYREEQEAEARRRAQGIDETAELYRAEMEAAGK